MYNFYVDINVLQPQHLDYPKKKSNIYNTIKNVKENC